MQTLLLLVSSRVLLVRTSPRFMESPQLDLEGPESSWISKIIWMSYETVRETRLQSLISASNGTRFGVLKPFRLLNSEMAALRA